MFTTLLFVSLWLLILVLSAVLVVNLLCDVAPEEITRPYRYGFSIVAGAFATLLVLGCAF